MDKILEIKAESLPFKHKFGMWATGAFACFVSTTLAEKAYMAVLKASRNRKS